MPHESPGQSTPSNPPAVPRPLPPALGTASPLPGRTPNPLPSRIRRQPFWRRPIRILWGRLLGRLLGILIISVLFVYWQFVVARFDDFKTYTVQPLQERYQCTVPREDNAYWVYARAAELPAWNMQPPPGTTEPDWRKAFGAMYGAFLMDPASVTPEQWAWVDEAYAQCGEMDSLIAEAATKPVARGDVNLSLYEDVDVDSQTRLIDYFRLRLLANREVPDAFLQTCEAVADYIHCIQNDGTLIDGAIGIVLTGVLIDSILAHVATLRGSSDLHDHLWAMTEFVDGLLRDWYGFEHAIVIDYLQRVQAETYLRNANWLQRQVMTMGFGAQIPSFERRMDRLMGGAELDNLNWDRAQHAWQTLPTSSWQLERIADLLSTAPYNCLVLDHRLNHTRLRQLRLGLAVLAFENDQGRMPLSFEIPVPSEWFDDDWTEFEAYSYIAGHGRFHLGSAGPKYQGDIELDRLQLSFPPGSQPSQTQSQPQTSSETGSSD